MSARCCLPLACLLVSSCGYHVAGHANLLPKNIRTIAIPAWGNATTRYKLADLLPAALGRELLSRTRFRVVADPDQADAILNGSLVSYNSFTTVVDPATGRSAGLQVIVLLQAKLIDRATGKVLFDRPAFEAREWYEISVDQAAFLDESPTAMQRLARSTAQTLVSAILEDF